MILSNREIIAAMNAGRLVIEPRPQPEYPKSSEEYCPYQTTSVDLRLGDEVSFLRDTLPINIDLTRAKFKHFFGANSDSRTIARDQPYSLMPGKFVLARTFERVEFPLSTDSQPSLAARIEGKSSYARCGVLVHFTAPTIHAGFSGTITLEIINLGPMPVLLYPEAPICQLIVEEVKGIPFRNDSQFQFQNRAGGQGSAAVVDKK